MCSLLSSSLLLCLVLLLCFLSLADGRPLAVFQVRNQLVREDDEGKLQDVSSSLGKHEMVKQQREGRGGGGGRISSSSSSTWTNFNALVGGGVKGSTTTWRVPKKRRSKKHNPGFNLDYSPPKTHPPSHN